MADSPGATAAGPSPTKETDCGTCVCAGHCARHCPERVSAIRTEGAVRVACATGIENPPKDVASIIDHTLLKPDATEADVRKLCDEARRYTFASVCINPSWVRLSKQLLTGTRVKVCTVVGFPLGATSSESKAAETHQAVTDGADEIDMVINVGALKAKDDARALEDIKAVVRAAKGHIVKVILETGLLTDEEKKRGCELSVEAGADFVKTSTGFGPGGATVADIELMRHTVGPKVGVKASGGVRDFETARKMIAAGATRIGASASVAIVKGSKGEGPTAAAGKGY
ncbi:MAG: deoxyribose-phosphate aldolase [Candidatus Riflebacteria bacterium]|nr:deoxyribose-phosphate aldolase [Candidatus Riflebacteria bacterium]